ncbi:MAG TPA: CocE/NonD family hydrolase [Thermoleophilaceae bacterium]
MTPRQGLLRLLAAALAGAALLAPAARAADPPPGSKLIAATIDEPDGTKLHADVLRPAGISDTTKTPVILSIGPYFNHSGQLGPVGLVELEPYDPITGGPSDRFYDFINGAKVFERGYTWVQVDLRGFGGSTGCLDWAGPGEQADVKAAVEWAASQPWSTGKVGMYGKSYDGVTGMMGIATQPRGLAAVISQEPVYDLYRYLYSNRVRYENSVATPALYDGIAASPGTAGDTLAYNEASVNDTARPGCPALNYADQQDPNHESTYWKARNLITAATGKKTPFFLTQGLLEDNTKPDGPADYFNRLQGPKRAWMGPWDHVRGNDKTGNRLAMGRSSWFDEAMRFYDRYVAGKSAADAPVEKDPPIALQTNDGKWRSEAAWPPPDSFVLNVPLKTGTYTDDGTEGGYNDGLTESIWTFSPPFDHTVELAGTPRATVDVDVPASNANLVVDVYDVDQNNRAIVISRMAYLLPGSGKVSFDLYDQDWIMPKGHRLGVFVTGANQLWWTHTPTGQDVTVKSASIALPFLGCQRTQTIEGGRAIRLDEYLSTEPFTVPAATIQANTVASFPLPSALRACSAQELSGGPGPVAGGTSGGGSQPPAECVDRRKFKFRIHQPRRGRIVRVTAYVNGKKRKTVRGRRVTRLTIDRLPKGNFTVKIVAAHSTKRKTISVRRYRGCKKGRPSTTVRS